MAQSSGGQRRVSLTEHGRQGQEQVSEAVSLVYISVVGAGNSGANCREPEARHLSGQVGLNQPAAHVPALV